MTALTTCIAKAGKAINKSDREFLLRVRKEYIEDGKTGSEATKLALQDHADILDAQIADVERQVESKGGKIERPIYTLMSEEQIARQDIRNKTIEKESQNKENDDTRTIDDEDVTIIEELEAMPILYNLDDGPQTFEAPDQNTWVNNRIREIQDKYQPLKSLQKKITEAGKTITDEMDSYEIEELKHTKVEQDQKRIKGHVQNAMDKMAKYNISLKEIGLYVIAKYAPDRNKMVARLYKDMDDKQLEMFPGMTREDFQDGGSGMTNAESKNVLAAFKKEGNITDLEDIASDIYAIIKEKNDILKESGTLTDEQHKLWTESDMFGFYVPLKGSEAKKFGAETPIVGKLTSSGFGIINNESMAAMGRRTLADSPFAHAIQDATSAIVRARNNEVGQAFLKLVKDNPKPEYWQLFSEDNYGTRQWYNPKTKQDETIELHARDMTPENGYMGVKVKGKQHYIKIIHDKRLLKAMTNMGPETISPVIRFMGMATRVLSSLNTSLNPEFVITNAIKDPQTAIMNALAETEMKHGKLMGIKDKVKFVAKMANPKTIATAIRGINRAIKGESGKPIGSDGKIGTDQFTELYQDFLDQGAKTGFFDSKSADEQAKDLVNMLEMSKGTLKGNIMKHTQGALAFIDRINTSVENGVRLSAYVHAVQAGMSKQKAASFAKNLTVNFNRKGEITWLNAIYMFGNASIQGTAQFVRSVGADPRDHPSGNTKFNLAQKAAGSMFLAGGLFAMLARETGGEADDGEDWFDKIDDYILERNIVIMKSTLGGPEDGTYWKIPLPYGYNIFHNLGTATEMLISGSKTKKNIGWASRFLTFSALGSFSPVSIGESKDTAKGVAKAISPTLMKPFVELALEEDHFGQDIFRNTTFDHPKKPDSIGKSSTPEHWKAISTFLNDVTGGSEFKPGFVDIAPESFEHLVKSFGGGLWRLGDKSLGLAEKTILGEEVEDHQFPFFRKVSGKVLHYGNQNDFYTRKDEIGQVYEELRSLKGMERIRFRQENKDILSLRGLSKSTEKKLRALRKRRKAIYQTALSNKQERLKKIEALMRESVDRFNKQYNKLFN